MRIARQFIDEIVEHAREEAPNECCGMIAARDGEAVRVYRATNAAASPLRYEVDPKDQLRIETEIDDAGLQLGAIYHSHTRSEPYPSQTDVNFAANWPGVQWLIIGVAGDEPDVRNWRIEGGDVTQVEVQVDGAV